MSRELIIREDFKALCPPLAPAELEQLHCSISGHGCRDPLVVWKGKNILVDGHNRYAYCKEHGIDFEVREIRFPNADTARNFIILNQLGRRNLSPEAAAELRGKLYYASKKNEGAPEGNSNNSGQRYQNDTEQRTRDNVAKETGVSPATVARDAAFYKASEKLGITNDVIAGKYKRKRSAIVKAAKELPDNPTKEQVEKAKERVMEKSQRSKPVEMPLRDRVLSALTALLKQFKDNELQDAKAIILEQLQ